MLLLEQDIIKKKRIDNNVRQINFDTSNNKSRKYKVEAL